MSPFFQNLNAGESQIETSENCEPNPQLSMAALSVLLKQRSGQLIGQPMVADALTKSEMDLRAHGQLAVSDPELKTKLLTLMQQAAVDSRNNVLVEDQPLMLKVQRSSSASPVHFSTQHRPSPSLQNPDLEANNLRTILPAHTHAHSGEFVPATTYMNNLVRSQHQLFNIPTSSGQQIFIKTEDGHVEPIGHSALARATTQLSSSSSLPGGSVLSSHVYQHPGVPQNLVTTESDPAEDLPASSYPSVITSNASLDLRKKVSAVEQFIRSPIKKRPYIPNTSSEEILDDSASPPPVTSQASSGGKRGSSEPKPKRRRNANNNHNSNNVNSIVSPATQTATGSKTAAAPSTTSRAGFYSNMPIEINSQMLAQALHRMDASSVSGNGGAYSDNNTRPIAQLLAHTLQPHQIQQAQRSQFTTQQLLARTETLLGRAMGKEEIKLTVPYMISRLNDSYNSTFTFLKSKLVEMRQKLIEYSSNMTMDNVIGKIISQHLKSGHQVSQNYFKNVYFTNPPTISLTINYENFLHCGYKIS